MISLLLAFMLAIGAPAASAAGTDGEGVRLICLNIGKADCLLLMYDGHAFLIDTGYEQSWPAIRIMLSQYRTEKLDGVFLTHCHKDHYGSMNALADSEIPVDAWYASSIYYDTKPSKHPMVTAAGRRGEAVAWLEAGDVIPAGENASFTVLGPLQVNGKNENNNSLVMRFDSPHGSILLTGDMKEAEEEDLAAAGAFSQCEILKCAHHGDDKATGSTLVRDVAPVTAVICTATGEERDTPAPSVLKRLESAGCRVYVTQDASDAFELSMLDRHVSVKDITWDGVEPKITGLSMSMDAENDLLYLTGSDEKTLTIREAVIFSSNGSDLFTIPVLEIPAGKTILIGSVETGTVCDYTLEHKKHIWHRETLDVAVLYDSAGRPIAWADNGLPEE